MGNSSASEPGLAPRGIPAASQAFATPEGDVDVTCRLALTSYLSSLDSSLAAGIVDIALRRPVTRDAGAGDLRACQTALEDITVIDPACGEGHFLVGMLDVLDDLLGFIAIRLGRAQSRTERRRRIVERNLYGVEVRDELVTVAAARLAASAGTDSTCQLNLVTGDSLVEGPRFDWATAFPHIATAGGFSLVVGNPPYLRHELIRDPLGRLLPAQYRDLALSTTYRRFPEFFRWNRETGRAGRPLDRRSDLCLLFLFLGFRLLHREGTLGFVVPTALFQTRYGTALMEFAASSGRVGFELRSETRRSFAAPVNTSVFIVQNRRTGSGQSQIRHIPIYTSLAEADLEKIWQAAEHREDATERTTVRGAPASRPAYPTRSLESIGRLRYAIKTGLNAFFYPTIETVSRFNIEPEFLLPVAKSPRDVRSIRIQNSDLRSVIFVCSWPKDELERQEKWGALTYIEWARTQVTAGRQKMTSGVSWPDVSSLRGRRPWYSIALPAPADILCPRFFARRFFFADPCVPLQEDQTFYGLILGVQFQPRRELVAAILNASLTYLAVESGGRSGLGDGVRQYALADTSSLAVLDPLSIPTSLLPELLAAYKRLAMRPILPIEKEVWQEDRHALDTFVAEAAGLRASDMENVRATLVELTLRRIARAASIRREST